MITTKPKHATAEPVQVESFNGIAKTVFAHSEGTSVDIEIDQNQDTKLAIVYVFCAVAPDAHMLSNATVRRLTPEQTDYSEVWKFSLDLGFNRSRFIASSDVSEPIRLLVSENGELTTTDPTAIGQSNKSPAVIEKALFFALVAVVIFAGLMYSHALEPLQKRFSVLLMAATIFISFFGIALTAEKFWNWVTLCRNWIGKGAMNITAFAIIGLLIWNLSNPTKCLIDAYRFETEIDNATRAGSLEVRYESARRALILFPNRPEPYLVLSKIIDDYRVSNRNLLEEFSTALVEDDQIRNRVADFLNMDAATGCRCTRQTSEDLEHAKRQVLGWYYFREAEANGILEEPIDGPPTIESSLGAEVQNTSYFKLRRAVWDFETLEYPAIISSGTSRELREAALQSDGEEFEKIRENYDGMILYLFGDPQEEADNGVRTAFPNDYLVQAALDKLVSHNIRMCNFQEARVFMSEILILRQRSADTGTLWLDGPEKFETLLFARLLRSGDDKLKAFVNLPAFDLRDIVSECESWIGTVASDDISEKQKSTDFFKVDFPDWWKANEEKWFKGSIESQQWSEIRSNLMDSSKSNWRF